MIYTPRNALLVKKTARFFMKVMGYFGTQGIPRGIYLTRYNTPGGTLGKKHLKKVKKKTLIREENRLGKNS